MHVTQESTQNIKYIEINSFKKMLLFRGIMTKRKNKGEKIKRTYRILNFGYSNCERKEVAFWADMLFPFLHSCCCGCLYFQLM